MVKHKTDLMCRYGYHGLQMDSKSTTIPKVRNPLQKKQDLNRRKKLLNIEYFPPVSGPFDVLLTGSLISYLNLRELCHPLSLKEA